MHIGDFLKKFKVIRDPAENRQVISSVIKSVTGLIVSVDNIKIQQGSVFLNIHAAQKGIIFMKKDSLLLKLRENLPDLGIKSIL